MKNRLNQYRIMWVFVFFDLPTETVEDRRNYALFRKSLQKDGFQMLQFSIYIRHCTSMERVAVHEKRVYSNLPPNGSVIVFSLTDKQFGEMHKFEGTSERIEVKKNDLLHLF